VGARTRALVDRRHAKNGLGQSPEEGTHKTPLPTQREEVTAASPEQSAAEKPAYGADNKLVTQDREPRRRDPEEAPRSMEKIVVNAVKKNGKASNPYRYPSLCEKTQGSRQSLKQTWLFEQENDDRQRRHLRGGARARKM